MTRMAQGCAELELYTGSGHFASNLHKFRHLLKAGVADQPRIALHAALVARAAHQPDIARALDARVERLREGLQGIFVALIAKTGRELVALPNIGDKALEEIEEALEKEGLSLETQDLSDLGEEQAEGA